MDRDEELLRGRVYGTDHDHPGPLPHRDYAELVGGPLDGLLLDIIGWTADEIQTGVALMTELGQFGSGGRNPEVREAAKKADRRLKGLRTNGDMRRGVRVAGDVHALFEHIEPKGDGLPNWLDLDVPDDRLVASTMLLRSRHPGSSVYVASDDINLQTKLAAVGLPFIEAP